MYSGIFLDLSIWQVACIPTGPQTTDRNMHFEPADFLSFTKRILKNAGVQKIGLTDITQDIGVVSLSRMPLLRHTLLG